MKKIRYPLFFWFNIVLLIVNLSIVISLFLLYQSPTENPCCSGKYPNSKKAMAKELFLDKTQQDSFYSIKAKYHSESEPVIKQLRKEKDELMQTLEDNPGDSLKIKNLVNKISVSQGKLIEHTTRQYIDIHKMLTPDQREKHRHIYRDILGCKSAKKHGSCLPESNSCMKDKH